MLAGMECAGSLVTVRDGDFSSPDAPRGTGGPKSQSMSGDRQIRSFLCTRVISQNGSPNRIYGSDFATIFGFDGRIVIKTLFNIPS